MHSKPRRWFIGPACALMLAASAVSAQEFPAKAVKVIVPFPPGGPVDVLARALGESFRDRTGQGFVVDNKPGGATAIGANACKNADPDGYTFCLLTASTISLNPFLYANLSYDPRKDLAPVTVLSGSPFILAAAPSLAAKSLG